MNCIKTLRIALLFPATAAAQSGAIPGRDLLGFPIGLVAEAGALPGLMGAGLFNPAAAEVAQAGAWHLAAAAMSTPADVGASATSFAVGRTWRGTSITASILRAAVGGLVRTDSDPLTVGNDVTYATSVASIGVSRRLSTRLRWGAAVRARAGQLDADRGSGASLDAGLIAEHLTRFDLRLGAATFLLTPFQDREEPPTVVLGGDGRILGRDSLRTLRAGASFTSSADRAGEQFFFAGARYHAWEVRGGAARTVAYGEANVRGRMGVAVHYGPYVVGLAREDLQGGLGASYQFVLSSLVR